MLVRYGHGTIRGTVWCGMVCGVARYLVRYIVCWYDVMVRFDIILYGKTSVLYMVFWWYGMMIRSGGCIIRVSIAWWYGMFQCIRSVRVECVV